METVLYILFLTFLAAIMSINSERISIYHQSQNRLRDDAEEKETRLKQQTRDLIKARDMEIHAAQLSERNRIAREIHDNVGHTLSRAILQMGALLTIHKDEPLHSEPGGVRATLDNAMNSVRSSVHDLHDESIDVSAAITDIAKPLMERFVLNLDIDISDDMPRPVKYAIIGIFKEAVSNIIKHIHSTQVDIRLHEHPSMYQLVIHDYGRAEDNNLHTTENSEAPKPSAGMGLENINTRVESVNGRLSISTDNGYRVFVIIPR